MEEIQCLTLSSTTELRRDNYNVCHYIWTSWECFDEIQCTRVRWISPSDMHRTEARGQGDSLLHCQHGRSLASILLVLAVLNSE